LDCSITFELLSQKWFGLAQDVSVYGTGSRQVAEIDAQFSGRMRQLGGTVRSGFRQQCIAWMFRAPMLLAVDFVVAETALSNKQATSMKQVEISIREVIKQAE